MKYQYRFPRTEAATDNMDSAMLAGLMATLGHPQSPDLRAYLYGRWGIVRCPERLHEEDWCQNPFNVTRDQLAPMIAGLVAQGHILYAQCLCKAIEQRGWRAQNSEADKPGSIKPWYNGADLFFGAEKEFCKNVLAMGYTNKKSYFWLSVKIWWHCFISPYHEPNQLIALMATAGPKYIVRWKTLHPNWKECVSNYWLTSSRQDQEMNDFIIKTLEEV